MKQVKNLLFQLIFEFQCKESKIMTFLLIIVENTALL